MKQIEQNFRCERERLGLSQAKLAELSEVPQHILSAVELGKAELTPKMLESLVRVLSDKDKVDAVAKRPKRYREHRYGRVERSSERVALAATTKGNAEYVEALRQIAKQHRSAGKRALRALSLFSGCGGFSLGFSSAGYDVIGFLELDKNLRAIYRRNFPSSRELGSDISQVTQSAMNSFCSELGTVDVIIGGPPCQGFSLSGKRRIDDPRNSLFRHYLRFVDTFQPKVAILENVRLLTSMKSPSGGFVKDEISDEFKQHGYLVRYFEINAKHFGVPQHRERVIFVAVRSEFGITPSLPEETHGVSADMFASVEPCRTFADACSDLPYIESGEKSDDPLHIAVEHPTHVIEWLWDVGQGCSAHDNLDENMRPPSGYNTTYKRQIWHEPASTVQTTFGMISGCRNVHPIATRSLTIREAARIQSFPDSFQFIGSRGAIRTGIGNAVPPLLANAIGTHLRTLLL